jgi:hypothetical protein
MGNIISTIKKKLKIFRFISFSNDFGSNLLSQHANKLILILLEQQFTAPALYSEISAVLWQVITSILSRKTPASGVPVLSFEPRKCQIIPQSEELIDIKNIVFVAMPHPRSTLGSCHACPTLVPAQFTRIKILLENSKGMRPLGRPSHKGED